MDIKQLEYFLELCKTGSFTSAAKNLYISTPGLIKSIQNLEEEMGVSLFVRTRSGTCMTKAGYKMQQYAENYLNQYKFIRSEVRRAEEERQKRVEVCLTRGLMKMLPHDFFSRFVITNQDIALKARSCPLEQCIDALVKYRAPVGILVGEVDVSLFTVHFQRSAPMYAVVSQDHPLARKEVLRVKDFQHEKVIALNADEDFTGALYRELNDQGVLPQLMLDGVDWMQTLRMVRSAGYISFCIPPRKGFPGTVTRPVEDLNTMLNFKLVTLKDIPPSPAEMRFIEYACERMNAKKLSEEK